MWTLPSLPCALPTTKIPDSPDLEYVKTSVVSALQRGLSQLDFVPDAVWRDHFAMTGTIRTFYSARSIAASWEETSKIVKPSLFHVKGTPRIVRIGSNAWIDVTFQFETEGPPAMVCEGVASVVPETRDGQWKIWVLRSLADQLKFHPSVDKLEPMRTTTFLNGVNSTFDKNGANGVNGVNRVDTAHNEWAQHFDVVILGGGQAGLATGGRLQALGASYVVLEKQANVGDSWKTRYDSTKLHTIREFGHLPFERTFTDPPYPEYLTKDHLAEGYQNWAAKYNINIWLSTTLLAGEWDEGKEIWKLKISQKGQELTITSLFFVFAGGAGSQIPTSPIYEGREAFGGTALHSCQYKNPGPWAGKHGVVVGTGNTAHDVAEDMLAAGLASVTMIQRSPTFVLPAEYYADSQRPYYNKDTPTELADRMAFTGPLAVGRLIQKSVFEQKAKQEPERFARLERAGFKLDREGELMKCLMERFGGYYMDVGCSKKISDGEVSVIPNHPSFSTQLCIDHLFTFCPRLDQA